MLFTEFSWIFGFAYQVDKVGSHVTKLKHFLDEISKLLTMNKLRAKCPEMY